QSLIERAGSSKGHRPGEVQMSRVVASLVVTLLMACALAMPAGAQTKPAAKPPASAASSAKTRTEHDLLGDKQIPADAYYGVQTARALENFQISGISMAYYPEFVQAFAMVKVAAARANTRLGAMKPDRLAAIE